MSLERYLKLDVGNNWSAIPAYLLVDAGPAIEVWHTHWELHSMRYSNLDVSDIRDLVNSRSGYLGIPREIVHEVIADIHTAFPKAMAAYKATHDPVVLYRLADDYMALLGRAKATHEVELLDPEAWEDLAADN